MALSIKTEEADRLARELSKLTGETLTDAVTHALRERLSACLADRDGDRDLALRLEAQCAEIRGAYDTGPVRALEWLAAAGERP